MYINHVTEERAEDILAEILSSIRYDEDWNDSFPSVSDYESFSPKDIEDAIAHPNALYDDEHAFASVTISYSVLHDRMKQIIETIIDKNAQCTNKSTTSQGIGFARALALYNIVYVRLYADFIYSLKSEEMHISYDIVCIIKKWGYDSETFYLLLAYWFSNDKEKRQTLEYLSDKGFSVNLKEDISVYENFVQALRLFLSKSGYSNDEMRGKYYNLFAELTDEYIFPHNKEKAEALKARYQEIVERLQNSEPVAELQKTPAISAPPRKRYRI